MSINCDSFSPTLTVKMSVMLPTGRISLLYPRLNSRSLYNILASGFGWLPFTNIRRIIVAEKT